ncbi:unnamed protein product [Protopolystoma xenopodis]|uniref:Uncharacterized protein n=1 Tax=Protopolystoma xenopodis TaxID=117903 RepID=A0A3S5BAX5_9PLAT|nr:unnamed protein product [Protopolystoma xenopodis]
MMLLQSWPDADFSASWLFQGRGSLIGLSTAALLARQTATAQWPHRKRGKKHIGTVATVSSGYPLRCEVKRSGGLRAGDALMHFFSLQITAKVADSAACLRTWRGGGTHSGLYLLQTRRAGPRGHKTCCPPSEARLLCPPRIGQLSKDMAPLGEISRFPTDPASAISDGLILLIL